MAERSESSRTERPAADGAGDRPAAQRAPEASFAVVGKPLRRVDIVGKVTGETRFADDQSMPNMLHLKLVRSRVPHARILGVDAAEALALPGVRAVLTARDFPGVPYGIMPVSQDEHPLCTDRVRFVGDPVAAVVAADPFTVEEAARLVKVRYEPLPTIASPEEALATPEPRLHEYGDTGNVHKLVAFDFGDVPGAIASADHVFEDLFFYQGNTHLPLEQHATLAYVDPDGRVTIVSSTQVAHYVHRAASKALGLSPARVRVIAPPQGGGFGGKTDPFNHEIVAARAAMLTGRPVKVSLTREEVFLCHRGRHPTLMRMRTGVAKDGRITGHALETLLDGGAYGSYGVASVHYTGALETLAYQMPRYRFRGCRTFTNKPPCGPKRGHGTPQPRFGLEVQLDKIACDLGIDPAEIRLRHLHPANTLTANFLRVGSIGLGACIDKVVAASGWKKRRGKLPPGRGARNRLLVVPLRRRAADLLEHDAAVRRPAEARPRRRCHRLLRLDGHRPGLRLDPGLDRGGGPGHRSLRHPNRHRRHGPDAGGPRLVLLARDVDDRQRRDPGGRAREGDARRDRGEEARDPAGGRGLRRGARLRRGEPRKGHELRRGGGPRRVPLRHSGHRRLVLAAARARWPPPSAGRYRGAGVGPSPAYSYSAAVVEVEVDPETGILTIPKIWIAHDVGKCINPALVMGQVEGSVYMGLGEAVMEEMAYRTDANANVVHKFPSMLEYKSPTTKEMPEVETYLVEDPDANGPFGAKEVGQGPLLPIPPAVANAVFDAVGVRVDEVPVTPEKVLRALKAKAKGQPARFGPTRFPSVPYPAPIHVPTPAEGGDGKAVDAAMTGAGGVR